jgi:hypothetical protein
MDIVERIVHLFEGPEAAKAWWQQMQCRMYTTACQLWHEQEDASTLLYGWHVIGRESSQRLTGVVRRLERKLGTGWQPDSVQDLEAFLWSCLRYEYKTLLRLKCGVPAHQLLAAEILEIVSATGNLETDIDPLTVCLRADERRARAAALETPCAALASKPELLQTLKAIAEAVAESDDAGEDATAAGWRKRVLQRAARRLGISQDTLHKRLERLREVWESVGGDPCQESA